MKGENIMTEEKTDMRILKRGTCPSLSDRSELTYEYGCNEQSKAIMFRIADNTGEGHFQDNWIPLNAILNELEKAKEPFNLSVFRPLYSGGSNNLGFLGAVLMKESLVISEKRKYLKKDTKSFMADLNKLVKPTKKKPTTKKS
jgi:hypothetical protein